MAAPVALTVRTWGDGHRSILLLHGITSSAAGWWRVGPDLADRGWRVVAPDLRGHGTSPHPGSYRFAEHVADIVALGAGWDAVVGHSMGGTIAILASSRHTDWTTGLVLLDPVLMMPEPMSDVFDWLLEEYRSDPDPALLAARNPRWHESDVTAKVEALAQSTGEMVAETIEENWPWMVLDEAVALEVPTVVLGSDPATGGILPVAFGEWLAATAPRARYQMLEAASHSAHRDDDRYDTYRSTLVGALEALPTL